MTREGGKLNFELKEPGNNRYDGVFMLSMDTASRKIDGEWNWRSPSTMVARREKIVLAPLPWDPDADDHSWHNGDTVLEFRSNGTCQLHITPRDLSAQNILVRGNYIRARDTFRLEWEKNPYIPEYVNMVEFTDRVSVGDDASRHLSGGGMSFGITGNENE